jgi:hypothetical protein
MPTPKRPTLEEIRAQIEEQNRQLDELAELARSVSTGSSADIPRGFFAEFDEVVAVESRAPLTTTLVNGVRA